MSIRIEAPGKDLNIAHKPYRIACGTCDAKFTFIEKDAQVQVDDVGFKRLSVPCPSCGSLCMTDHHENDKVRERLASEEAERMERRGKVTRAPKPAAAKKSKAAK